MNKILMVVFSLILGAGVVNADSDKHDDCEKAGHCGGVVTRIGIITDIHHTDKPNTT